MRLLIAPLSIALAGAVISAQQPPAPIIDMHLHASAVNSQGPPPVGLCAPFADIPMRDAKEAWPAVFGGVLKKPACANPIWSPTTDEQLMTETLAMADDR